MTEHGYDAPYYEKLYGTGGFKRFSSHWWAVRYYALLVDKWMRRTGGRRILEIGCGHGFVLARLADRYETFGVDISPYAVEQCARFAPKAVCYHADLEEGLPAELSGTSFDFVLAKYVFEHLREPAGAMATVRGALRPGGLFFYSVPNLLCPGNKLKGDEWYARKDPTHVSLLPPEEWLRMTREAGFTVRSTFSDGFWDLPYFRRIPKSLQFPLLAPTALACLTGWEVIPAHWGENLMVIAERTGP